jgi:hypothetical protein
VLQVVVLFFAAGIAKFASPAWLDGSAVGRVLTSEMYAMPLGNSLAAAAPGLMAPASYAALAGETFLPLLLLLPSWRARAAGAFGLGYLMIGIALTMTVGHFPIVAGAGLCACVPARVWGSEPAPVMAGIRWTRPVEMVGILLALFSSLVTATIGGGQAALPPVLFALGVSQNWGMFGHPELLRAGSVSVVGRRGGASIDCLTGQPEQDLVPPFATLVPFRERRVLEEVLMREPAGTLLPDVAAWYCARFHLDSVTLSYGESVGDGASEKVMYGGPCPGAAAGAK